MQHQNQDERDEPDEPDSQENTKTCFLDDSLYCNEDKFMVEEEEDEDEDLLHVPFSPSLFLNQELFMEDEQLISLFHKENDQKKHTLLTRINNVEKSSNGRRGEAVDWILKVNAHHGFTTLTAIFSINYLDRFLLSCLPLVEEEDNKPWMIHLVAVTCLSLASKVEETQVPNLLHLQVEGTKYVFDPKTIERMEVLVLSTLQWRMHPVTPLCFLNYIIITRIGLKTHLHWQFLKKCEALLLNVVSDSRFLNYLPSTLATAIMMNIINQLDPLNSFHLQNQLLGLLKISKEKVKECYELILQLLLSMKQTSIEKMNNGEKIHEKRKRKYDERIPRRSPSGVIDSSVFSCDDGDSSNDSWVLGLVEAPLKKSRGEEQQMRLSIPSGSRCFVDIVVATP